MFIFVLYRTIPFPLSPFLLACLGLGMLFHEPKMCVSKMAHSHMLKTCAHTFISDTFGGHPSHACHSESHSKLFLGSSLMSSELFIWDTRVSRAISLNSSLLNLFYVFLISKNSKHYQVNIYLKVKPATSLQQ